MRFGPADVSVAARCAVAGLLVACASPAELDPDGDPGAFWAWCTDAGRGSRYGGDRLVANDDDAAALEGVALVDGDLTITSATLTRLTPLASLRCVRGDLVIEDNAELESLAGLEALVAVGGEVAIRANARLRDLAPLAALRFVAPFQDSGGDISISANPALTTLAGLGALEAIHGDLDVQVNRALVDLAGPTALLGIDGELHVRGNDGLVDLDLPNLGVVGRGVRVENNAALEDVRLPFLRSVDIDDPDLTISFTGLQIRGNRALRAVRLGALTQARTVVIEGSPALEGVDLAALVRVESVSPIAGELTVVSDALTAIDLSSLESVDGDLRVDAPTLDAFVAPRLAGVGEDLEVGDDAVFPTRAPALSTLDLSSLRSVGGRLRVRNTALTDLEGLPALVSVGRDLTIEHNPFLTALVAWTELAEVGSLAIASNRSLPTCAARAVEEHLVAVGFSGPVRIAANDDAGTCP